MLLVTHCVTNIGFGADQLANCHSSSSLAEHPTVQLSIGSTTNQERIQQNLHGQRYTFFVKNT